MDGLRARAGDRVEDALGAEVGVARRRGADPHGDVGLAHVARTGVGVGVDGDRADAQAAQRADDPDGDLAAVGDEDGLEHARHIRKTP